MINARIAFNLHSLINNPYSSTIRRPSLRFASLHPFPRRFGRIHIALCTAKSFNSSSYEDDLSQSKITVPSGGESVNAAAWVGVASLTSKILGLLREVVMASVFGVGPVATAFKYAWVLPGLSSSLLGGVNGPIHIIMATTLSLWILAEGQTIRQIAVEQLKIMTPCIVLAGLVGLGFGCMSAEGNNTLPSISPALSSSLLIVGCLIYNFTKRLNSSITGGSVVSAAVSLGLFLQWIIQVMVLRRWPYIIPDSLSNTLTSGNVREFFSLLLPPTVSSGLAQIASFTDLFFASLIPGAAAGLSYAYLTIMAPLGALSSIIVLPLVPAFSKLTSSRESLVNNLERALLLCMVILLPIFSVMRILAKPIIHVLFERAAFDSSASALVSSLFLAYSLGATFIIARDLLVAAFYALGDGKGHFLVSAGCIALNAILDWLSVLRFNLGARGLPLSTSFTVAMSVFLLFHLLKRKVSGLSNYAAMIYPTMLLLVCCIVSSFSTSAVYKLMHHFMRYLLAVSIASVLGIIGFFVPVVLLHISGFELVQDLYRMLTKQQTKLVAKSFNLKQLGTEKKSWKDSWQSEPRV